MEEVLGLGRVEIAFNLNNLIKNESLEVLQNALNQLKKQVPIQYIIGNTTFYNLKFNVSKDVLIPRPETEELVQWIINDFKNQKPINVLDIGTGSGCIAISLAKYLPNAKLHAIDISEKAIEMAKKNAKLNDVDINFIEADILVQKQLNQKFDCIVSNPPYVQQIEKTKMEKNVLDYEPHQALFVPNENPLLFYNAIATFAQNHLHKNGSLYFEINRLFGTDIIEMLQSKGFNQVILKQDFYNADRMIKATTTY
jgi:release factor glutamine methyltransferase